MSDPHPSPGRARLAAGLAVGILAVSFAGVLIRGVGLAGVPFLAVAFYRMAFATAMLAAAAAVAGTRWPSRADAKLVALSGLCLAGHFGLWTLSFAYIPVARSVLIVDSQTIFVVAASALVLKERPTRRVLAGVATAIAGILVVSADGFLAAGGAWRGDLLALGGAVAVVGYILAGRLARARLGLLGYVVPVYAVATVALLVWCVAARVPLAGFPPRAWLGFLLLAVVPTIFGHTVFNWLLGHLRADAVSVAFLAEPVGAAALAYLFFGEVPSAWTLAGAPLVLTGLALASSGSGRAPSRRGVTRSSLP
jgi:drug/metabolite transporter (DMT)-like permease